MSFDCYICWNEVDSGRGKLVRSIGECQYRLSKLVEQLGCKLLDLQEIKGTIDVVPPGLYVMFK